MSISEIQLIVEPGTIRSRLEEYLFDNFPRLSRMYIRDVIREERCQVNGRVENKGKRVSAGDFIEIKFELDRQNAMRPEAIPLEILHEDDDVIAINKPAGMLVHPTHREKNGTLLNALSYYLNREVENRAVRPGLVHRLDKETSGVLLVAKNLRSHRILARQFQRKTIRKIYLALVGGIPKPEAGTVCEPIGRFPDEKRWGVHPDGSQASTHYRVLNANNDNSLLELTPATGRTNQLRIHCAHIGHPIVGDVTRGGKKFESLCLHAQRLNFRHPADGRGIDLAAPAPKWLESFNLETEIDPVT